MNEPLERALDADLDGTASPAELATIEEALTRDPQLRAQHEAMKGLLRTLGEVPLEEPPVGVRAAIMREVRTSRGQAAAPAPLAALAALFGRPRAVRYAMVFAAGLVAGALALAALPGRRPIAFPADAPVAGALAPRAAAPARRVDASEVVLGDARVRLAAHGAGQEALVTLEVDAPGPLAIELGFDPAAARPARGQWQTAADGGVPPAAIAYGQGRVSLRHAGGAAVYRLGFTTKAATVLEVTLRSAEGTKRTQLRMDSGRAGR